MYSRYLEICCVKTVIYYEQIYNKYLPPTSTYQNEQGKNNRRPSRTPCFVAKTAPAPHPLRHLRLVAGKGESAELILVADTKNDE